MRRSRIVLPAVLFLLSAAPALGRSGTDDRVTRSLALLPGGVDALVLVPCLDRTGDEITACLEGMERSALLLGSRPVDQVKSATGLLRAVNDLGPVLVAWTSERTPCAIVSVNDAAVFLDANFDPDPTAGAWRHSDGRRLFARAFDGHVVLAEDDWVLTYAPAGPEDVDRVRLTPTDGDLVVFARRAALARGLHAATGRAIAVPSVVRDAVLSVDFDPLGVILRAEVRFVAGEASAAAPPATDPLARIARGPALVAGAIVPTPALRAALAEATANTPWRALVPPDGVRAITIVSRPDPPGGLLGAVAVHVAADPPDVAETWMTDLGAALAGTEASVRHDVAWTARDDGTRAFVVSPASTVPAVAPLRTAEALVFGARGWRGRTGPVPGGALAILGGDRAWTNALAAPADGLAGDGAVRTIRRWLPARRVVEAYLDVGILITSLEPILALLAPDAPAAAPRGADVLPPVGIGVALDGTSDEPGLVAAVVVPAPVAAIALDAMLSRVGRTNGPGAAP